MSGFFRMTTEEELPKHAHLCFYTREKPRRVLSFVDTRRFGTWHPNGAWQADRGPCVMFEYQSFRENVLSRLSDRAFDRPICEVLLNQKYFNGIGNYLRAEILHRLNIPPFESARAVLQGLDLQDVCEMPDLLSLCHTVPLEVVSLGGKGYDPEKAEYTDFEAWLQCYYVDGMKSIRDHNGRTVWFKGDPGPMVPKESKSTKARKRIKKDDDHDYTEKKKSHVGSSSKTKMTKKETRKAEKDARLKEAGSRRRKVGKTSAPRRGQRTSARRGRNGTDSAGGLQKQSRRRTRQSSE